jgi:DNA-directed RNA polymerase subunit RPC12/RpoP
MNQLPCLLCGKQLDRRIDRNRKPYFHCDPCGIQLFIRRRQGIDNLNALMLTLKGRDLPFREHAKALYEVQAILMEIRGLQKQIDDIDSVFGYISKPRERKRALKSLEGRIDFLLSELENIASGERAF